MKHRFFKDKGVEMVEITVAEGHDVVVRPATKEDHDNAKHDDPEPKETHPETHHAKKPKDEDD